MVCLAGFANSPALGLQVESRRMCRISHIKEIRYQHQRQGVHCVDAWDDTTVRASVLCT